MKVLELRALRGPNRYDRGPAVFLLLDAGDLAGKSADELPEFTDRLLALLPDLGPHELATGARGTGGAWPARLVRGVALELQRLAGMDVAFGETRPTGGRGIHAVVYRYLVESAGLEAGRQAVELVEACAEGRPVDLPALLRGLAALEERDVLGPSIAAIAAEAEARGIPVMRLDDGSFVQLGHGARQRWVDATMNDRTSAVGVEIADQKSRTKEILVRSGVPVPEGRLAADLGEALAAAAAIGWPVVVKPDVGRQGGGVTLGVDGSADLAAAYAEARRLCRSVLVEKHLAGSDFRLLAIAGRLVAAALREPAHVVGDGRATVRELVERVNADPRRGLGHKRPLTKIRIDAATERLLARAGLDAGHVPAEGEKLTLKSTANLSTGGTARDVTEEVHPEVRAVAERIARLIGLDCVGIDIVAPGLDVPLDGRTSGVVEVNAAPGLRMHLAPTEGRPRDVAAPFVDMLFPPGTDFELPIVAITGTNGKTTTARLVAHALKQAGHVVGLASTAGVDIDGVRVVAGDYSGPEGAGIVLREPTVERAVLETARGGILRRGLGFERCRVGVLLNVAEDHLGNDGVDTLDDLAEVKATVLAAVEPGGTAVVNADDAGAAGVAGSAGGRVVLFSLAEENPAVRAHLADGGTAVVLSGGSVVVRRGRAPEVSVLEAVDAPITCGGAVAFQTANVLAAVAALDGLGLPVESIRRGVLTFTPARNPGRMNLIEFPGFRVLLDYGHNAPAVAALGAVLGRLAAGRKLVVAHGTGSRTDCAIRSFGAALAAVYDEIVVTDADPRRREPGETAELVRRGALDAGFPAERLHVVLDPPAAIDRALSRVAAGDVLVVQVDDENGRLASYVKDKEKWPLPPGNARPPGDGGSGKVDREDPETT